MKFLISQQVCLGQPYPRLHGLRKNCGGILKLREWESDSSQPLLECYFKNQPFIGGDSV